MFGAHGQNANFIVSSLSELLDKFLAEYLRVNEAACTESPPPPTPVAGRGTHKVVSAGLR